MTMANPELEEMLVRAYSAIGAMADLSDAYGALPAESSDARPLVTAQTAGPRALVGMEIDGDAVPLDPDGDGAVVGVDHLEHDVAVEHVQAVVGGAFDGEEARLAEVQEAGVAEVHVEADRCEAVDDGGDADRLRQGLAEDRVPVHDDSLTRSCLLYTSPSPRDRTRSRMPSSA